MSINFELRTNLLKQGTIILQLNLRWVPPWVLVEALWKPSSPIHRQRTRLSKLVLVSREIREVPPFHQVCSIHQISYGIICFFVPGSRSWLHGPTRCGFMEAEFNKMAKQGFTRNALLKALCKKRNTSNNNVSDTFWAYLATQTPQSPTSQMMKTANIFTKRVSANYKSMDATSSQPFFASGQKKLRAKTQDFKNSNSSQKLNFLA